MKSGLLRYGFSLILCFAVIGWVTPARAESFSRISDIHGSLNLKGSDEEDWTPATLNLLLKEEDRLETGYEATAEVEMPGLARVQVGNQTRIRIKGYGGSDSRDEVVLESGGVFVEDRSGTTVIETSSAAVSPNSESTVRVDVDRDGTRVRVAAGSAQVQTLEDGRYASRPMLLLSGEEMVLDLNARPEGPRSFYAENDALDRYGQERVKELGLTGDDQNKEQSKEQNLNRPLMGSEELVRYGEWVTVDAGLVWHPYVAAGWRPYFNGYWAWYDPFGWTWISYDPFGYVTFHYGAWMYDPFFGWCWVPGYVWRPAYVSWIAVGPYYAWAPLDPFGRVVFISNIVVVNRIDHRVFTVAPKRTFVVNAPSTPSVGRRFIPPGMRMNGSIRGADARVFRENPSVEPIKDLNAVRPVHPESGRKFETSTLTVPAQRPNRTDFPKPAQSITRETGVIRQSTGSTAPAPNGLPKALGVRPSRTRPGGLAPPRPSQGGHDSIERREVPAQPQTFPRVGRPERQSHNGGVRYEGLPRPDQRAMAYQPTVQVREHRDVFPQGLAIERRPGSNQGGIQPGIVRGADLRPRAVPGQVERRTVNRPQNPSSIPNPFSFRR